MTTKVHHPLPLPGSTGGVGTTLREHRQANCEMPSLSASRDFRSARSGEGIVLVEMADANQVSDIFKACDASVNMGANEQESRVTPCL